MLKDENQKECIYKVIRMKDTSYSNDWSVSDDFPLLQTGGDNPAKCNFCMEVAVSEETQEEMGDDIESFFTEDEMSAYNLEELEVVSKEIAEEIAERRISYYVGLVKAKSLSESSNETLLRSKSRFSSLSVDSMLEKVLEDVDWWKKDWVKIRKEGKEKSRDALFTIDGEEYIDLDNYISKEEGDLLFSKDEIEKEILAEYRCICCGKSEEGKLSSEDEGDISNHRIHPYAVNIALLFELYARTYIRESEEYKEYNMLGYVSDKKKWIQGDGAKTIAKDQPTINKDSPYYYGVVIPDIVLQKKENLDEYKIFDVKYKNPDRRQDRDDRLQILAYAYMYNAKEIGHIFPENEESKPNIFEVNAGKRNVTYEMKFIE